MTLVDVEAPRLTSTPRIPTRPGSAPPPTYQPAGRPTRGDLGAISNLTAAGLNLAAVYALSRVFKAPWHFFFPVAAAAVAAHVAGLAGRVARLSTAVGSAAIAAAGLLVTLWVSVGHLTAYGFPGPGAWSAIGPDIRAAAYGFTQGLPPVKLLTGSVLLGGFGVTLSALLADAAAFRYRRSTAAAAPSLLVFAVASALAEGRYSTVAVLGWLSALMLFILARQMADNPSVTISAGGSPTGSPGRRTPGRGRARLLMVGAFLAAVTLVFAGTSGPAIRRATGQPVWNLIHPAAGGSSYQIGSPLVNVQDRLRNPVVKEVMTVKADHPSLFRLTALDGFNGLGWTIFDSYQKVGGSLPDNPDLPTADATTESATFHIGAMDSIFLPSEYRPVKLSGVGGGKIQFSPDTYSLITAKDNNNGATYTVTSQVPHPTRDQLEAAPAVGQGAAGRYLELPSDVAPQLRSLAIQHTTAAHTPYEQAELLEKWLSSPPFKYSLTVPADDHPDALIRFLTTTRAGFCQQYAGSFAALARSIGLPARVAVGFVAGRVAADGLYHVTDRSAYAWPEVYFQGIGWMAFNPTPGQGPAAAAAQGTVNGAAISPLQGAANAAQAAASAAAAQQQSSRLHSRGHAHHSFSWWLLLVIVLVVVAAGWIPALSALTSWLDARARARARTTAEQIVLVWALTAEELARRGLGRRPAETTVEYGRRVAQAKVLDQAGVLALRRLAQIRNEAAYAGNLPAQQTAVDAALDAATVAGSFIEPRPWWRALLALADPRPVVRGLRREWQLYAATRPPKGRRATVRDLRGATGT